jgi:preprotein translocase subunit SecB
MLCKEISKMADQDPNSGGNGADDNGQPQVSILAQYVKDLSVENPSAPKVYSWQVQPTLDVQFNLNVEDQGDGVHEVTLKFDISARSDNGVHFVIDLTYSGLFGIRNLPQEALPPFLLIEAPRLLFPFARQVIAEAISSAGFPPLMLDPIDFGSAYMAQLEAAQQQQSGGGGGAQSEQAPSEA